MVAKELASFRFSKEMLECLDELASGAVEIKEGEGPSRRTAWLEKLTADFLCRALKGHVSPRQLAPVLNHPQKAFKLFLMFKRAERAEKNYSISKDKYVCGPLL